MLGALGSVAGSEYNNAGDLIGVDGLGEVIAQLTKADPITRQKVINKLAKPPAPSQGSRAEMEKHFAELPDHIREGLMKGQLRLADTVIYTVKPVNGSKTIKMFEPQDVKEVGLRNIDRGRLPKNMALIVSGIFLLTGTAASAASDDVKSMNFDFIDGKNALSIGEITLKGNKKSIIDSTSLVHFKTNGLTSVPHGYYKLHNPRVIQDDVDIECDIELGSITGVANFTYYFLGLHGTVTIP
jgi:hypothetical protein